MTSSMGPTDNTDNFSTITEISNQSPISEKRPGFDLNASVRRRRRPLPRISTMITQHLQLDDTLVEEAQFRNRIAWFSVPLTGLAYFWFSWSDNEYDSPLKTSLPISVTAILMILGATRLTDASTNGERFLVIMAVVFIFVVSIGLMSIVSSSCFHCVYLAASNAVESKHHSILQDQDKYSTFDLLFFSVDEDDHKMLACRGCVSSVVSLFVAGRNKLGLSFFRREKKEKIMELYVPDHGLRQEYMGDLVAWYIHWANENVSSDVKAFNNKVAEALADHGHLAAENLTEVLKDFLCSPASRVDNPDPVRFLEDLKTGRFTGEEGVFNNISTSALQRIMRGDILDQLGASVCFMLRFALFVPTDYSLEATPISPNHLFPSMNEEGMKTKDISAELPGVILVGMDQDVDRDSATMGRLRTLMDVYTQFPFQDDPIYFDTKAEYLAFYRWELVRLLIPYSQKIETQCLTPSFLPCVYRNQQSRTTGTFQRGC